MLTQEADTAVTMTRILRASPATVFNALIRPELLQRWMCPETFSVAKAEADPRVGGRLHIEMRSPEGRMYIASGTYTEVRAPELLVFTWAWEGDHEMAGFETNITIELSARGDRTFLLMTHFGLPTEPVRTSHQQGWNGALANLERLFESGSTAGTP